MDAMDFFKGLRLFIARASGRNPVSAAVSQMIRNHFIPFYKDMAKKSRVESVKEEGRKAWKYWVKQARDIEKKGDFDKIARNIAGRLISDEVPGATNVDDELQEFALWLLKMRQSKAEHIREAASDVKTLKKYMTTVIWNRLIDRFKYLSRHELSGLSRGVGEDEEEVQLVDLQTAPKVLTDWDQRRLNKLMKRLKMYVWKNTTKEQSELFDQWMEAIDKKGPDDVNFRQDVAAPLAKKDGKKLTRSAEQTYYKRQQKVNYEIVNFFKKKLQYDIPKRTLDKILPPGVRKSIRTSSDYMERIASVVAAVELERRMARWILSAVR